MTPLPCGCRACGGPTVRADAVSAREFARVAPFVVAYNVLERHATPRELANRSIAPSLYSRLVLPRGGLHA